VELGITRLPLKVTLFIGSAVVVKEPDSGMWKKYN